MLTLNLRSAYLCCRAALPGMLATRHGRIVNVASRSVVAPTGGFIAYTVAKSRRDRADAGPCPGSPEDAA